MSKTYSTDLSDAEWSHLDACHPAPQARGRPRIHSRREILDAIFYALRSGCTWRLLPHDFPPWQTVYYHLRRWRMNGTWLRILSALHASVRQRAGRHPEPTAAIMDSQSVKSTQESGGSKGYDAHKNVVGRKRHILVDTLGPLLSVLVTPADVQTVPAHGVWLAGFGPLVPRLETIWADGAYGRERFARWCHAVQLWGTRRSWTTPWTASAVRSGSYRSTDLR